MNDRERNKGRGKGKDVTVYARRKLRSDSAVDGSGRRHVRARRVTVEARTGQQVAGINVSQEMEDVHVGGRLQVKRPIVRGSDGHQREEEVSDNDESSDDMSDSDEEEDGDAYPALQIEVRRGAQGKFIKKPNARKKEKKKDESWMVKGPIDGGPRFIDTIPSFLGHIASNMGSLQSRAALRCYSRHDLYTMLGDWYRKMRPDVRAIVDSSGLGHLQQHMFEYIDMDLISAFIERWQLDTNSFHMPFGEIMILLHDVHHILGIPVEGEMVRLDGDADKLKAATIDLLGMAPKDLTTHWYQGGGVNAQLLADMLRKDGVTGDAQAAGWIFVMLGSTLFVDKSGSMVRAGCLLECKKDVHSVHTYSWDSATLANMYRQLGQASRRDAKGICGCLSLLQAWIYEYFPVFRPHARLPIAFGSPRIAMWKPRHEARDRLPQLREVIDQLIASEISWLPYGLDPASVVPRTLYTGCIRCRKIIEPYMPSRCVRQLGYVQDIPVPIIRPSSHYRPYKINLYSVKFSSVAAEDAWRTFPLQNMLSVAFLQPAVMDPAACVEGYIMWYSENSHPRLLPSLPERALPPHSNVNYWVNGTADFVRQTIAELRRYDSDKADQVSSQFQEHMRGFNSAQ